MILAILITILVFPLAYYYLLVAGAILGIFRRKTKSREVPLPKHRFAVTVAAHNEEAVIGQTVSELRALDYPTELFDIHVVADWCTDRTAELAEEAGAITHPRSSGPRGGKGSALSFLFSRILSDDCYDAVVVFDADTQVDSRFLRVMDLKLGEGHSVIQGQHRISNPEAGWFPALTEAKFLIDNLFQNLGRSALGLSAKNMGDSICLRAEVLRAVGWGQGLTEDFQLRQKLLLAGFRIAYAEQALGRGEAPPTWGQAKTQRLRWMKGAKEVSQNFRWVLLKSAFLRRSSVLLDAALECYLPTFSTLSAAVGLALVLEVGLSIFGRSTGLIEATLVYGSALGAFPLVGLFLSGAPLRAYVALLGGPVFVAWRAWAGLKLALTGGEVVWVRTQHGKVSS